MDGVIVYQREESQAGEREEEVDVEGDAWGMEEGENERQATSDVSRQPHQIRVIVHNDVSESLENVIFDWFKELKSGISIEEVRKDESSLISNASPIEIYTLNLSEVSKQENQKIEILENLKRGWCQYVSSKCCRNIWLEVEHSSTSAEALLAPRHEVEVMSISLGSFPSSGKYIRHWCPGILRSEVKIAICFEYDLEIATISYEDIKKLDLETATISYEAGKWKLEMGFHHLHKFLLVTPTQAGFHVYLFQNNPFKIYEAEESLPYRASSDVIDKEEFGETQYRWKRQVVFSDCPRDIFGSSNVVHLEMGKSKSRLSDVLLRFAKLGFSILTGNPSVEDARLPVEIALPEFKSFRSTYAWFCLVSRGFRVTDQVTKEFTALLYKAEHKPWFEEIIRAVTEAFDNSSICNLENLFQKASEKIRRKRLAGELNGTEDGFLLPHAVAIRRLILTPTTIKGLGEEWTVENRVLRNFGADRFVRVSFRDQDFTRLTGYIPIQEITNRIIDFLTNGFNIGNRHYRFLGCSNSQLRSHSVWMYTSDGQDTVESIRTWMGDVSHERCVATYVSRLGQCFTSTRNTVEVKNVERIEDIHRDTKYCFTDGIGRISTTLAARVKETLNLPYVPSAFQIRFGGCKGVVALAPDIGDDEKLQIRKSMEKFSSEHCHIEVAETSRPVRLCLNRQAMLLLSGLGVPDDSFFRLQDRMLTNMANILIDENAAVEVITKTHLEIKPNELTDSGIAVTVEPFLREVLATIYRQRFNDLMRRTHIEIPEDKGRLMMGTVDEFDCLEYGEVFIRFSKEIVKPMQDKVVVTGQVVVTKSPCFHPGDMRKLMAVDRPQLHHMVDCIVFPAKGQRPHPNEMSGSDLDGDLYFVCWEKSLIPPGENKEPMDFTPKEKRDLPRPVTESDMIEFIARYIEIDQLGVIANAHLVHADSKDIHCDQCVQIAKIHSDAVDFPKTGQKQKLCDDLRPASYPDYMMKTDKPSYISDTVIGKCFHQCRVIELSNEFRKLEPIPVDSDLILPGHETYLNGARAMKAIYDRKIEELMSVYGIESEVELLSVGSLTMKTRLGHIKGDHYSVTEILKLSIDAVRTKMKQMFYEEFGGSNGEHDNTLLCLKASALYRVSYSSLDQSQENNDQNSSLKDQNVAVEKSEMASNTEASNGIDQIEPHRKSLGLPWIFCGLLCMIRKQKSTVSGSAAQELRETQVRPRSFLHKLSLDMATEEIKITAGVKGHEQSHLLQLWSSRFSSCSKIGVQLICIGSAITSCTGVLTSLDVYAFPCLFQNLKQLIEIAEQLVKLVGGNRIDDRKLKPTNTVKIANIPGTVSDITLYSDASCLQRTAYIVAAVTKNKWAIPILRVVLQWGRNCKISDNSPDSLLTEEELTIMFYHALLNGIKYGNPVTAEDLSRSSRLIRENHFQTCSLFQCTHLPEHSLDAGGSSLTDGFSELAVDTDAEEGHPLSVCCKEDTLCGRAILGFFRFYGVSRGSNLKEILDPSQLNDSQSLLNLKDQQYVQVGEQMMEAYHCLANCSSIHDFVNPMFLEDRRLTMVVPNEVTSLFQYSEPVWADILQKETGVSVVHIRRKKFGRFPSGHIIEAWGGGMAIKRLSARIQNIVGSAACFTEGKIARDRWSISGARRTTFQDISGPKKKLGMFPYRGRCQDWHNMQRKQVPLVTMCDYPDVYNVRQVVAWFEEQREFIRKNYKPQIHGRIRVTISFGNFYTVGFRVGQLTAEELTKKLFRSEKGWKKEAHVRRNIHTPADYRHKHSKQNLRPASENVRMRRTSHNSPPISHLSGNLSSYRFGEDSAFRNSVPRAHTHSGEVSTKQIPANAFRDCKEYLAEKMCNNSDLPHFGATGHSINIQNSTLDDSSIDLTNSPPPQHLSKDGIQEAEFGSVSDNSITQTPPFQYATPLPRPDSAFLPMDDLDLGRFYDFLRQHDFVETEHLCEYRATANLEVAYGDIVLNDDFELKHFRLQDIKWYVFNLTRGVRGRETQRKDIRIQVRSRPVITADELAKRKGCKDLLENAKRLLHKNSEGEVDGIALPNYRDSIDYMRYKDRTCYQFLGRTTRQRDGSDDSFLTRFRPTMKLNRGKEYRLPENGIFKDIKDHTELILETDLPNLEDKEACGDFMRQIYQFSKRFAMKVIDD